MLKPMWKLPTDPRTLLNTTGIVCPWNLLCILALVLLSGLLLLPRFRLRRVSVARLMLLDLVLVRIWVVTLPTQVFPQLLYGALARQLVLFKPPVLV